MQFRLCLALGIPHPDYLLPLLTSTQMHDWEIYSLVEPFGQPRSDIMAGVIAAASANVWLSESNAVTPGEMIGEEKPEPTMQEMKTGLTEFLSVMR